MRAGGSIRGFVAVLAACAGLAATAGSAHAVGNVEIDELTRSSQNANVADTTTRRLVLEVAHPTYINHYGGQLQFGPDGFLYAGTGDGGSGGDPNGNARNSSVLLGKLLRLDVSPGARGSDAYAIPAGNPAAGNPRCTGGNGTTACPEVVASGLRNPFRFSFDSQAPHDLWIGDVGQDAWEEIDHSSVASVPGSSYGWDCMEGNATFSSPTPSTGCPPPDYVAPVYVYPHSGSSKAVTGGIVVRDPALTPLLGRYLYTDYYFSTLHSLDPSNNTDRNESNLNASSVVSFNEDAAGHVYVTSLTGSVKRVACNDPCSAPSDLTLVSAYTDSAFNPVNTPISVAAAPGDTSRLFIVERGGRIRLAIDSGSGYVVQDTPFLDLHSQVNTAGEGGLLSMAFDPEYAQTGLFYVYFANFGTSTAPTPPTPPTNPPSQQPPPIDGPIDQPSQDAQNSPTLTTPVATKDVVAPVLHVRAARTQDLLRRGDVRLAVACNEACVVRAAGSARGVRLRSMLKRLGAAKRVVFELRLSSRARRALAKRGTVKVTLRGRDAAGNVSTASLTVRVKRR